MPISIAGSRSNSVTDSRHPPHPLRYDAGMTLIELMVGMAVVGVILSVVVGGMRNVLDTEMKSTASRLGSTIRYLYNKAVTERLYLRVVYDLDEHSYKVEATTEPFVISTEGTPGATKQEPSPEEPAESESAEGEEEGEVTETAVFSEEESYILKAVTLGSGVYFKDVQVSYQEGRAEEGLAYTYFFPNGYATPTVINLRDEEDEDNYSLEVLPLSGRVRIRSEYRELHAEE